MIIFQPLGICNFSELFPSVQPFLVKWRESSLVGLFRNQISPAACHEHLPLPPKPQSSLYNYSSSSSIENVSYCRCLATKIWPKQERQCKFQGIAFRRSVSLSLSLFLSLFFSLSLNDTTKWSNGQCDRKSLLSQFRMTQVGGNYTVMYYVACAFFSLLPNRPVGEFYNVMLSQIVSIVAVSLSTAIARNSTSGWNKIKNKFSYWRLYSNNLITSKRSAINQCNCHLAIAFYLNNNIYFMHTCYPRELIQLYLTLQSHLFNTFTFTFTFSLTN